jgi:hypothetical protein
MFDSTKKKYFKKRLDDSQKMLWDYEFKQFKAKELRESLRKEHDRVAETIDAYKTQIENKANTPETIKTFEEKLKGASSDLDNLKLQIIRQDEEIGVGNNEAPGLQSMIDGLHELRKMIQDYIAREL